MSVTVVTTVRMSRSGSEVDEGIVGWNVCFTRLHAQKQTDGHRPQSDLVLRAAKDR